MPQRRVTGTYADLDVQGREREKLEDLYIRAALCQARRLQEDIP